MLFEIAVVLLAIPGLVPTERESAKETYYRRTEEIRAEYRIAVAQNIRKAKKVQLFLLRFDGMKKGSSQRAGGYGGKVNGTPQFEVVRYGTTTDVIRSIELEGSKCAELLIALASQVQKPAHSGGAMCHFPIHGLRVFSDPKGENLVYSGTFCWKCSNFGFAYPQGSAWLDTSEPLRVSMNRLLPIPEKELERFEKKHPSNSPTIKKSEKNENK